MHAAMDAAPEMGAGRLSGLLVRFGTSTLV
jgi:hypothetical protein